MLKRIFTICLLVAVCLVPAVTAFADTAAAQGEITVLFTHDLHSHLLPSANENGEGEYGGYARLMTAIREQRAIDGNAILVDGGDFSMGSLFQTAYPTSAIELRMMGAMGYDATTLGNHEFDYLPEGLASMLGAAVDSGDALPALVLANYLPPKAGEEGYNETVSAAFDKYGVKDYILLERGGVHYAIFGIFGHDADDCAPNSGMVMEDPVTAARRTVDAAVAECESVYGEHPVVICLSHSGTEEGEGEDYELAKAVDGIDVIVSGHTHTELTQPISVNGTLIVSAAEYGRNLGVLKLRVENDEPVLVDYRLIPIDGSVPDDPAIASLVEGYKRAVEVDYLSKYGYTFDEILVSNPYRFDTVKEVYATQHESTLGNLFADAYKRAAEQVTGRRVDVAVTATGVIRGTLPLGNVTVSDVFNAASLGVGTEGELVGIYLTGKDLKNAIELDASIPPLMSSAQLFMSGVEYSFNLNRMIFNKVDYAMLRADDGTLTEIEDERLYFVVAGMYMGQMLGSVEETSMGILSVTPRDGDGNPIAADELVNYVIRDDAGNPLKEWYAIADYLGSMVEQIDVRYATTDGRKVVYESFAPADLLRNANIFTYAVILLIALIILAVVFIVRAIVRRHKRRAYR